MSAAQEVSHLKSYRTNDSVNIKYRQVGESGPVVVMIHGMTLDLPR